MTFFKAAPVVGLETLSRKADSHFMDKSPGNKNNLMRRRPFSRDLFPGGLGAHEGLMG